MLGLGDTSTEIKSKLFYLLKGKQRDDPYK